MDNESAFPHPSVDETNVFFLAEKGMSLRDYFAGQALVGCASIECGWESIDAMAVASYALADAMLKERAK